MIKVKVTERKQISKVRISSPCVTHKVTHLGKDAQGGDKYEMQAQCAKNGHVGQLLFSTSNKHGNTCVTSLSVPGEHKRKGYGSRMLHALHDWHSDNFGGSGRLQYCFDHEPSQPSSMTLESLRLEDIPTAGGDLGDLQRGGKTPIKVKVKRALKSAKRMFTIVRKKKKKASSYVFRPGR